MVAPRRPGFAADLATPPNIITLSRLALFLTGVVLFIVGWKRTAIALAVTAGITDYVDGWLARRTNRVTRLGEILDQFCDVFFESTVIVVVTALYHFLPLWIVFVYLTRELWVMSIRRFMAGHQLNIASTITGKLKSNFILWGMFPTFLSIVEVAPMLEPALGYIGRASIIVGLVFSYVSGWGYTRQLIAGYDKIAASRAAGTAAGGDG